MCIKHFVQSDYERELQHESTDLKLIKILYTVCISIWPGTKGSDSAFAKHEERQHQTEKRQGSFASIQLVNNSRKTLSFSLIPKPVSVTDP